MKNKSSRKLPRPFKMHWGKGQIVEEGSISSEHHVPCIQLMKYDDGGYSIRFASYNHKGMFQRYPLMMDVKELKKMKSKIRKMPLLKKFLRDLI